MSNHVIDQQRSQLLSLRADYVIHHYLVDHGDQMLRRKVDDKALTIPEAYAVLKDLARDPKTGVQRADLLRYALEYEIRRAQEVKQPLAVGIFDIDHFKQINNELTHVGADKVLLQVADIISHEIRTSDDVLTTNRDDEAVIRWGGEEFVVIYSGTAADQAYIAADRLRQRIEKDLTGIRPEGKLITVSGGLTDYRGEGNMTWEDILRAADIELLKAKEAGRNQILPQP